MGDAVCDCNNSVLYKTEIVHAGHSYSNPLSGDDKAIQVSPGGLSHISTKSAANTRDAIIAKYIEK